MRCHGPSIFLSVLSPCGTPQVGDLVPLEQQSAANARRQLDLNVTSVAVLTAQLLRAFLAAPLHSEPAAGAGAAGAAGAGGAAEAGAEAGGAVAPPAATEDRTFVHAATRHAERRRAGLKQTPGAADTERTAPQRQRRRVTVVNISSVSAHQPYEHFSVYGTGKAARHMLVRCVAHEAELREAAWARRQQGEREQGRVQEREGGRGGEWSAGFECTPPFAVVRAMSYAPGAINTEMQVSGAGQVGMVDLRPKMGTYTFGTVGRITSLLALWCTKGICKGQRDLWDVCHGTDGGRIEPMGTAMCGPKTQAVCWTRMAVGVLAA